MTFAHAKKRARELTSRYHWPSPYSRTGEPDWKGIYAELRGEMDFAVRRNDQIALDWLCELTQALTIGIRKQREEVSSA
jgi:hypothetical protein